VVLLLTGCQPRVLVMNEPFFRRFLPHWQPPGGTFFITYRLAGTLPEAVLEELRRERQRLLNLPKESVYSETEWRIRIDRKIFALLDDYLDKNRDIEWLSDIRIAEIVRDNLFYHAASKYYLWAYVIMPNHVHLVLQPAENWIKRFENVPQAASLAKEKKAKYERGVLSGILHSLRSYTGNEANKVLGRTGSFWNNEYYDHLVRDNEELQRIIYYVENNPVKAGLVRKMEDWRFSSAYDRVQKGLGHWDKLV